MTSRGILNPTIPMTWVLTDPNPSNPRPILMRPRVMNPKNVVMTAPHSWANIQIVSTSYC